MSSDWPQVSLREFVDLLAGFAFKSSGYTEELGDIRLLRGDNIAPGKVRWDGVKRWSRDGLAELSKYSLEAGDVVLAMDRPWIPAGLKVAQVNTADTPSYLVQRVARLRASSVEDRGFLFALLSTPNFESYIQNATTGTAVPHISAKQILDFPFRLPPAHVRAQVGALTSALDDRITLLRETNATLEAIAQALFKSWFVDFDPVRAKAEGRQPEGMDATTAVLFPDSFVESELGMVPKGWSMECIGKIAVVIDCLHAKKPELVENGYPFLQLNNIRDDGLLDISRVSFVSQEDYQKWTSRVEVQGGDCVITNVGRVGAVSQIPSSFKAAMGRNMTAIRLRAEWHFPTYLIELMQSNFMRTEIVSKTDEGTILSALNVKSIPRLRFILPSREILTAFERVARPLRASMEENAACIQTLTQLRDTLLPRLISGQVRLPEAEQAVEEALA